MTKSEVARLTRRRGLRAAMAELRRRGVQVGSMHMRRVDLSITATSRRPGVWIRVTAKSAPNWQVQLDREPPRAPRGIRYIRLFVDISDQAGGPRFWITRASWTFDRIREGHKRYLARHNGKRPINPNSRHATMTEDSLAKWADRWDLILGSR